MTYEEFAVLLSTSGISITAVDNWTIGMALNYIHAFNRDQRRRNGEEVPDPDAQYRKLKAMQPQIEEMHSKGQIHEERYKSFMQSIKNYEKILKEG